MAARIALTVLAVAVLAWLGVAERGLRLQAGAVAAGTAGELARADADLRAAGFLNPDSAPDLRRAFVLRRGGRGREAIALVEDVVAREPDNLTAWALLATFARETDPAAVRRALAARRRLDPLRARAG